MKPYLPSLRDLVVVVVDALARLADKAICAWPNLTGGDE